MRLLVLAVVSTDLDWVAATGGAMSKSAVVSMVTKEGDMVLVGPTGFPNSRVK